MVQRVALGIARSCAFMMRSSLFCRLCHCLPVPLRLCPQPKQINEIKDFLLTARRKDAKCAPRPAHVFPYSLLLQQPAARGSDDR
jgi:hypothetical protein